MRRATLFLLFLWASAAGAREAAVDPRAWHRMLGILQYLQSDYPAALETGNRAELEEQRAFVAEARALAGELGPSALPLVDPLARLQSLVDATSPAAEVQSQLGLLMDRVVAAGGVERWPRRAPSLEEGRALYAARCAACHGASGEGSAKVAPSAARAEPPPASFLEGHAVEALSPYKVFNTVTFGIPGTAMAPFSDLTEEQRWAVAFHVLSLRHPSCSSTLPQATLEELATSTDPELAARFGGSSVACLRRALPAPDALASLSLARRNIEQAMQAAQAGDARKARTLVLDAYLSGLEPVEPLLKTRDPGLVARLEHGFQSLRLAAESGRSDLRPEGRALLEALADAAQSGNARGDFWSVLLTAALILLREGFEATVVVAALLAVLKKAQAMEQARWIHFGWMSALVAGAAGFLAGRSLLAGANREWLEATTGVVAVAMLLYAALWLNSKASTREWMHQLRGQMADAFARNSRVGLFAIAFTATFRESIETAIFLQGLSTDSASGVLWGALAGIVGLLALVAVVRSVGFRLPMKALFNASTALLVVTAVVMAGKATRAFQELGLLPLLPLPVPDLALLGLYADALTLGAQGLVLLLAWLVWRLQGTGTRKARLASQEQRPAATWPSSERTVPHPKG